MILSPFSQPSAPPSRQHALVIGGSMTGLLAARVLSDHFAQVTLVERDQFSDRPESRRGQPQTRHLHGLLASGKSTLERYFPDLIDSLRADGAIVTDMAKASRWYAAGGYRLQYDSSLIGVLCSRPFLEWQIRRRVLALPNLTLLDQSRVAELLTTPDRTRVIGVKLYRHADRYANRGNDDGDLSENLTADLVVDATGRNSTSPKWLAELGYRKPPETVVTVEVGYATRLYRRPPDASEPQAYLISGDPPEFERGGIAFPIESDRWIITLAGWASSQPPLDEAGFLAFARSLPASDIYDLIRSTKPLSEITGYKFPASLRRHYERLKQFPSGYLVMGDAICSFDPVYGQGMTSAALQAALLDDLLQSTPQSKLASTFFHRAAKIIDRPWQLTVSEDFRFSGTKGNKPLGTNLVNAYGSLVQRATHTDSVVYGAFLAVMNLMSPPSSLFRPKIIWRVFNAVWRKSITSTTLASSEIDQMKIPFAAFGDATVEPSPDTADLGVCQYLPEIKRSRRAGVRAGDR